MGIDRFIILSPGGSSDADLYAARGHPAAAGECTAAVSGGGRRCRPGRRRGERRLPGLLLLHGTALPQARLQRDCLIRAGKL